ncbi:MAG: hypothetical protein HOZ81_05660 [Streptomyces sp.]|nr:hypothetical protein [Streptomyces sp.]
MGLAADDEEEARRLVVEAQQALAEVQRAAPGAVDHSPFLLKPLELAVLLSKIALESGS